MTISRKPIIASAFDGDFRNDAGRVQGYLDELTYYRPRGFSKLAKEGAKLVRALESDDCALDTADHMDSWFTDVESMLTDWARRVTRNELGAIIAAKSLTMKSR